MLEKTVDDAELKRLLEEEAMRLPDMETVVSGISGRFPKADSLAQFEENLLTGVDMINQRDDVRWDFGLWDLPPRAGRIRDVSKFDNEFFGMSAEEANVTDHQLRIMLEVVYEAILDAGVNPAQLRGSNTGLLMGLHSRDFEVAIGDRTTLRTGYFGKLALRVMQYFDLRGINGTYDTACASSFSALNEAVQAIDQGKIERAIVCGVTIQLNPTITQLFANLQMVSPEGNSCFLDARADGYVKADACVAFLVQKKHLALRQYVSFLGIKSSADGFKEEGITFPGSKTQEALVRETMTLVGITTNQIEYFEAHGTGTPAGDKAESDAIANVYAPVEKKWCEKAQAEIEVCERKIGPLLVGSTKTNMGHPEAASGLCALTKVALMLENELIYRSLNFEKPNPKIQALIDGRIAPVLETSELKAKVIPVSCFGFGGTNHQAIVRASKRPAIDFGDHLSLRNEFAPRLVVMFGRSRAALEAFFNAMLDEQSRSTRNCLTDDFLGLVDALSAGPIDRLMNYRGYLLVDRRARALNRELARRIVRCQLIAAPTLTHNEVLWCKPLHVQETQPRRCHIILPGLGCNWPGMAAGLFHYAPFWSTIKRLSVFLEPFKDEVDLIRLLTEADEKELNLPNPGLIIPVIAYEIAMINIIRDQIGLNNLGCVVGHSIGEISAAYAVGLVDEREAIMVAYRLSKTLWDNKNRLSGKMVAVALSEEEALKLIREEDYDSVQISCINGPKSVTISGFCEEMDCFIQTMQDRKLPMKTLESGGIVLHNNSILSDTVKALLRNSLHSVMNLKSVTNREQYPNWLSCLSGGNNTESLRIGICDYFSEILCRKVDFLSALELLEEDSIVLELAPSGLFESQLRSMDKPGKRGEPKFHYVKLMNHSTPVEQQHTELLKNLGQLYLSGATFSKLTEFSPRRNNINKKQLFPVRRQTPSLSSLFKWKHEQDFFVPRYPDYFSITSYEAKDSIDLNDEKWKFLADHKIDGRTIFPATGYLYIIWQTFSTAYEANHRGANVIRELVPVEFSKVKILRAVVLGSEAVELCTKLDLGTGRFQLTQGESLVVEGFIGLPKENTDSMLYEDVRKEIMEEQLDLVVKKADIYKQFRVRGYDYGPKFQNIEECSPDSRRSYVSYKGGNFTAFFDSILSTLLLNKTQHLSPRFMILPVAFDYLRIRPEVLSKKIEKAGLSVKIEDKKNRVEKRIRLEMLEQGQMNDPAHLIALALDDGYPGLKKDNSSAEEGQKPKQKADCLFEIFCDPVLSIIITDGFEMRGAEAMPVARKVELDKVTRRSLTFVRDWEDLVSEPILFPFDDDYVKLCNLMAFRLMRTCVKEEEIASFSSGLDLESQLKPVLEKYLLAKYNIQNGVALGCDKTNEETAKNVEYALLRILNQLDENKSNSKLVEKIPNHKINLTKDLINRYPLNVRCLGTILSVVCENICSGTLKIIEINEGEGLMHESIREHYNIIEPALKVEYLLAHRDVEMLLAKKLVFEGENEPKTHKLTKLNTLLTNIRADKMDLIVYKDFSCYELPKAAETSKKAWKRMDEIVDTLSRFMRENSFVHFVLRAKLTLAEQIVFALFETEPSRNDKTVSPGLFDQTLAKRLNEVNLMLKERCSALMKGAQKANLLCVQKKGDANGYLQLLFKKQQAVHIEAVQNADVKRQRIIIRIEHNDRKRIELWLKELQCEFKKNEMELQESGAGEKKESRKDEPMEKGAERIVWLCAVATRQQPTSGLIGLMKSLRKEQNPKRLRCYFDCHTFAQCDEPITVTDIESCSKFREAVERDLVWNCVDAEGNFGAYRLLEASDYLSHRDCLCAEQVVVEEENEANFTSDSSNGYFYANTARQGDLTSFTWLEAPFKFLEEEEKRKLVRVAYSSLNFKDVLLATGRLPPNAQSLSAAISDCSLGFEFSGHDADGKRVMGMVSGRAIASHVLCADRMAVKIEVPDNMSLAEAATIPVVYATAIMALVCRGKARSGESVLIHAGSGGVGQAAIRIAQHLGLRICTTVGTKEKRDFLLQEFANCLSDERIFSSRDCYFEQRIMELTEGRGVDLVLNSLADDKLQASVRCLADGGRFLEIGKYDSAMDRELELNALDTNKTFHGVHLDKMFDCDVSAIFKNDLKKTLKMIELGLRSGYVKPIKYTVFEKHRIEGAFRFMATGKHIGKVLIEIGGEGMLIERSPAIKKVPSFQVSAKKSYIVTGGLGGFGLELIKWLVELGARHFVVTSRSGIKSQYQALVLNQLASFTGAKFVIMDKVTADTTTRAGVERLCQLALDLSPDHKLGAIFHLAMVLKDVLMENMTADDFELVCKPKIDTFTHLDLVTREMAIYLDHMVVFSSGASAIGNAGQSNYAYANSCMEHLCERRRRDGLPALAIQWGAIGDVGYVSESYGNDMNVAGTIQQRLPSCFATFSQLACSPLAVCTSVLEKKKLLESPGVDLVQSLFHILGIKDPLKVSDKATLSELGMDSLMAVEVRQFLIRDLDVTLDQQEIRALTIEQLRELNKKAANSKKMTTLEKSTAEKSSSSELGKSAGEQETLFNSAITNQREKSLMMQKSCDEKVIVDYDNIPADFFFADDLLIRAPLLRLPTARFRVLNPSILRNGKSSSIHEPPLFVFPPADGDFSQLEKVCSKLSRLCVGVNWTYQFSKPQRIEGVVKLCVELFKEIDWNEEPFLRCRGEDVSHVVDLLGFSFGAIIAFELMVILHKFQKKAAKRASDGLVDNISGGLRAGRLIILDYTPQQAEFVARVVKQEASNEKKLAETLMFFMAACTNKFCGVKDVSKIYKTLAQLDDKAKLKFASKKLLELLEKSEENRLAFKENNDSLSDSTKPDQKTPVQATAEEIEQSMCAAISKRELVLNYKSTTSLQADCALIRASRSAIQGFGDDLRLGSSVEGQVDISIFEGTHNTFLEENYQQISRKIEDYLV